MGAGVMDKEGSMQEAVANFQPKGQDLDYPGKLESAAASAETEQTPLVGTAVPNGDSSTLVSLSNNAGQCCLIYTWNTACFHSKHRSC